MFFAHPESLELLKLYPKVLIIDCTYNTNSAKMPLFEVIRVEATRKSFCVSFEFLPVETKPDYIQALLYLKEMLGNDYTPGVIFTDKEEAL
jgi:MULE transposase domain